jgi:hypothetical protein
VLQKPSIKLLVLVHIENIVSPIWENAESDIVANSLQCLHHILRLGNRSYLILCAMEYPEMRMTGLRDEKKPSSSSRISKSRNGLCG